MVTKIADLKPRRLESECYFQDLQYRVAGLLRWRTWNSITPPIYIAVLDIITHVVDTEEGAR